MRALLHTCLTCLCLALPDKNYQVYEGPRDKRPATLLQWREEFTQWQEDNMARLNLSLYDYKEVKWARTSFIQPQLMIHDRFLYDRDKEEWTVGRYLADVKARYGGIDSILLWQNYPNIGIDDRNQFDMLESLPGGLQGLAQLVEDFHREGVKVLLPYNPWDQFTRDTGKPDYESIADAVVITNSDGFNGDTLDGVNRTFWEESLRRGHPMVIEPEYMVSQYDTLQYNAMSWGYWTMGISYPIVPPVAAYKALTQGKHQVHICERSAVDRTTGLQYAFFNGIGYESWENVWGMWNQITDRDAEALRRISAILRRFGSLVQGGGAWIPHVNITPVNSMVFASEFSDTDSRIWLLVNRDKKADEVADLYLNCKNIGQENSVLYWFDIYHGAKIVNQECDEFGFLSTSIDIEAGGYGAVYLTSSQDDTIEEFLVEMAVMTELPLKSFSADWKFLPQQMLTYDSPPHAVPLDCQQETVLVPGGVAHFYVHGNAIECDNLPYSCDVQFPWEDHPQRSHARLIEVNALHVDKYPVTNEDYKIFLESGWEPTGSKQNWLRDWGNGSYPEGSERQPVVWVSHTDAMAYCNHYGKRLPHSWEWQWFVQGSDGRTWPWGEEEDLSRMPVFTDTREMPPPDLVDSHPAGASWAGVEDLVGNIYQWTDVFTDEHTTRAVLRGSPHWRPTGTEPTWYQPMPGYSKYTNGYGGPLKEHNTFLLVSPGMDRSGGIGFRCVVDAE